MGECRFFPALPCVSMQLKHITYAVGFQVGMNEALECIYQIYIEIFVEGILNLETGTWTHCLLHYCQHASSMFP